jgi:hypothetical protein
MSIANAIADLRPRRSLAAVRRFAAVVENLEAQWLQARRAALAEYRKMWAKLNLESPVRPLDLFSDREARAIGLIEHLSRVLSYGFGIADSDVVVVKLRAGQASRCGPVSVILGGLGVGKSTLLKRVGAETVHDLDSGRKTTVPIFCRLPSANISAPRQVKEELLRTAVVSVTELPQTAGNQLQWLLDGLDEMPAASRRVLLDWAQIQGDHGIPVIISSRPSAAPPFAGASCYVWLSAFDRSQIEEFVSKFPWPDEKSGITLLGTILATKTLSSVVTNPLMLTLTCLVTLTDQTTEPVLRMEWVYDRGIRLFLGDWERSKGLSFNSLIPDQDLRMAVLSRAAFDLFNPDGRFTRADLERAVANALPVGLAQRAGGFCDELLRSTLIEPVESTLRFLHLSVHEFLAARYLAFGCLDTTQLWRLMRRFDASGFGEEVLVFFASLRRDVGPLVDQLVTMDWQRDRSRKRRLIRRWMDVADLTKVSESTQEMLDASGGLGSGEAQTE